MNVNREAVVLAALIFVAVLLGAYLAGWRL